MDQKEEQATDTAPKRFAYYHRLGAKQKATYRTSDAAKTIFIPNPAALALHVANVERALATGKRALVATATTSLANALLTQLEVTLVKIHVRIVRPQLGDSGELHGLYTFAADGKAPKLEVWMRTAAHERVVAFRTFLRTVMHEIAHHLDVTLLGMEDSFHTQGFFRRESSLVRQLLPPKPPAQKQKKPSAANAPESQSESEGDKKKEKEKKSFAERQLSLF